MKKISKGLPHSLKIKQSPGWARYQAERKALKPVALDAEEMKTAMKKAVCRVRRRKLTPDPQAWLKACGFDLSGIREQLRKTYICGYVAALRDVKQERERREAASYENAFTKPDQPRQIFY
jgi:hypothetical protein